MSCSCVVQPEEVDLLQDFMNANNLNVSVTSKNGKLSIEDSDGNIVLKSKDTVNINGEKVQRMGYKMCNKLCIWRHKKTNENHLQYTQFVLSIPKITE